MKFLEKITCKIIRIWAILFVINILIYVFGLIYCASEYKFERCNDDIFGQFIGLFWFNLTYLVFFILPFILLILIFLLIVNRFINLTKRMIKNLR